MRYIQTTLALVCCLGLSQVHAQSTADSVRATVNSLFTAMKNADSAALGRIFDDSAVLQTVVVDSNGVTTARSYPVAKFAMAIGRLPKGAADEQIHIEMLKFNGPLASVWAPYHFYYNGTLIHCGVDSFQLLRTRMGWKILYIVDTMKRGAQCE